MMILPSSHQTRWGLDGLVAVLSIIAIAISASSSDAESKMYTGFPGDVRGLMVIMGSAGLIGTTVIFLLRLITLILPKVWSHYLDRLGFTFVSLMWICWASATMSFALFTIDTSLCRYTSLSAIDHLPTCPKLTFDLTLLHLISVISFGQVLNYLTIALNGLQEDSNGKLGGGKGNDGFVMWELAINSNPPSPILQPRRTLRNPLPNPILASGETNQSDHFALNLPSSSNTMGGYGATATTSIPTLIVPQSEIEEEGTSNSQEFGSATTNINRNKDKFSKGRLWTYIPLNLCSLVVACTAFASIQVGEFTSSGIFMVVVAFGGIFLSLGCLITHFAQKRAEQDEENTTPRDYSKLRKDRMLEVGLAGILFVVWPVSAILYTLFPPTPYQPCSNPSASAAPSPGEDYEIEAFPLCQLGKTVVILSWIGSWLLLTRIMGLIFPITHSDTLKVINSSSNRHIGQNEENRALLEPSSPTPSRAARKGKGQNQPRLVLANDKSRHQKGWERVTAGEEFELGSEDEED